MDFLCNLRRADKVVCGVTLPGDPSLSVLDTESAVPTFLCIPLPGGDHSSIPWLFFLECVLIEQIRYLYFYFYIYIYIYVHIYVCLLTVLAETEAGTLLSFPIIPAQVHFPWFSLSLSQYEINLGLNCHLFLTKIFKRHKESQEDLVSVSTELCPAGPLCSPGAWQRLFVALHGPCAWLLPFIPTPSLHPDPFPEVSSLALQNTAWSRLLRRCAQV